MAEALLAGRWPSPAVVVSGPSGSGVSTLVARVAEHLQRDGELCVTASRARELEGERGGVAVLDGRRAGDAATTVVDLVRRGWRVVAGVDGPSAVTDTAFGPMVRSGAVTRVALPALEREVRAALLRAAIPSADRDAIDLLADCAPGDGHAVAVLAARALARAGLAGRGIDVDVAAGALRGGRGARPHVVPVPVAFAHEGHATTMSFLADHIASRLRPLAPLGGLGDAIDGVTTSGLVAVAGGQRVGVAHRAALHLALAGRAVLLVTARERSADTFGRLRELAGGALDPLSAEVLGRLDLAVLADAALSLRAIGRFLPRVRPHVGFAPEVVVVDGHDGEPCDFPVPVVVVGDRGAAGATWEVDDDGPSPAVREAGGRWRSVAQPTTTPRPAGLTTDETGAVLAWRLWSLVIDADGVAIASPVRSTVWPRGVLTSSCPTCGSTPRARCRCGIYAFSDARRALAVWRAEPHLVFGELRCWGRIARHDDGIRAEHAQPVRLHLGAIGSEAERLALSARYGCDVVGR